MIFFRFGSPLRHFRQPRYHLSAARLSYVFSVHPAPEIVEKDKLFSFFPVRADDILVHYIRHEIPVQSSRINELAARLLDILHKIPHHLRQLRGMAYRTELVPPESLSKKRILPNRLLFSLSGIEIPYFFHLSRHCSFGDIEYPVKMQTVCIFSAFPRAYVQPVLSRTEML